jgi:hypothetical protein
VEGGNLAPRLRVYGQVGRLAVLAFLITGLGSPGAAAPAQSPLAMRPVGASVAVARAGLPKELLPLLRSPARPSRRLAPLSAPGGMALPPAAATLPEVLLTSPTGLRAPLDSVVRLEFSEAVDQSSVERSFRIEPPVAGSGEWADSTTYVFRPQALAFRTTYRVSVAGVAIARRRLAAFGSYTFTTMWPPPSVPFSFTLTFDDCGTPNQIQAILTALADRGLHAIFFPTGACRDTYPWLLPALQAAGHRICNHTYSHPDLTKLSDAAVRSEIQRGIGGCELFRPPYGALDKGGRIVAIAASLGYRTQLWDVDTRDWAGTPADVMTAMIRARGGVVLMHMHGVHSVEAIRAL